MREDFICRQLTLQKKKWGHLGAGLLAVDPGDTRTARPPTGNDESKSRSVMRAAGRASTPLQSSTSESTAFSGSTVFREDGLVLQCSWVQRAREQPEPHQTELPPSVALEQRRQETPPHSLSPPALILPANSQRPGQVAKVDGTAQASVCLQQGHDDRHGRLVVAGAAGAGVVHDVYAQVGVVTWTGRRDVDKKNRKTPK